MAYPISYDLNIHSLHDDNGFPWITHDTLSFCTQNGCGGSDVSYQYLNQMHQSAIPRIIKTKVAASHGEN
uniref:Uncharacterized protein n=1 Tax=Acrobeloides nanus TaxID=290746 RepID=A0A914E851_9BILA